jgi:hypothetical protein
MSIAPRIGAKPIERSCVIGGVGPALLRAVFLSFASRSLGRSLFGEREAISLFPASCAFLSVVSAFAVSHKINFRSIAVP